MKYPIYLDNNSTTPVDPRVIDAMLPVYREHFGNPASVSHEYGWYSAELVTIAREKTAAAIGAAPEEIVFTSGATESINLALQGVIHSARSAKRNVRPHVVTAPTEHKATLDTLHLLAERGEIELTELEVSDSGQISPVDFELSLKPNTVLVSLLLANNEVGTLHDIAALTQLSRMRNILFHCDATQALGKLPFTVDSLGVDLLSITAHKINGPKGSGALYLRKEKCAQRVDAMMFGGGHEGGMRSGTLDVPGIVGLGTAASFAKQECAEVSSRLIAHSRKLLEALKSEGLKFSLNGPALESRLAGNLNIYFPGVPSARLLPALQGKIACSASSACSSAAGKASHVLQALGFNSERVQSSIRIGIGKFNTESEIDRAGNALADAVSAIQA